MLILNNINKQYNNINVVNDFSYAFESGIYGLLGENGAGKTTLMKMICNILKPNSGERLYNGKDINALGENYRNVIGYLPQHFGYYPDFTGIEFLNYLAILKGLGRAEAKTTSIELLEVVNLIDDKDKK